MQILSTKWRSERHYRPKQFEICTIGHLFETFRSGNLTKIFDDRYHILWLDRGTGSVQIDLKKARIEPNTVYYVKPGQGFLFDIEEPAEGFLISFAKEFVELYDLHASNAFNADLLNQYSVSTTININSEIRGLMQNIAGEMLSEFMGYQDLRSEVLKGYLKIFIIYLSRQLQPQMLPVTASRKKELTEQFFSELEKHFATKKMVKEYADILAVTPSYLNDTVKEISGFTASYHIKQRIVLEAKRRAVLEGYSMKETAYLLGFFDPSHFSKYFKNSSGVNFTDFKKGIVGLY